MQNTYRVHYFPNNGRACNIRALLSVSKAKWENEIIEMKDWPAVKATGKYEGGMVPALEVNGKLLSQTPAIELYLARTFGLMGSNVEEEYQITNILGVRDDSFKNIFQVLMPNEEQKANQEGIIKNMKETMFPALLKNLERRFIENGAGKYFVGNKLTLADIFLANTFAQFFESQMLKQFFSDLPEQYAPKISAMIKALKQADLKEYFEKDYNHESMF